jgi:hypothetical protein
MARRLWPLVLALVIGGAPLTVNLCQAACASHEVETTTDSHRHACAPSAAPASSAMGAVPHPCGHQTDDPVGIQHVPELLTAPAWIVMEAFPFPAAHAALPAPVFDVEPSPPDILALTTQRRV